MGTDELRAKAKQLRQLLGQVESVPGVAGRAQRTSDAERKRRERAKAKDVVIPPCADRERRLRLEQDDEAWLAYYFGPGSGSEAPFTYAFTAQQKRIIEVIASAILKGDDKALAASRGEGKTTYCERLLLKYVLQGTVRFAVLLGATKETATTSLDTLKLHLESNDRLLEDYPEVCVPVRALENTPSRAHFQTVSGHRHDNGIQFSETPSRFKWCGREVTFPDVPGSPAAKAIFATRGLDSAVRGLKKKDVRPDIVVIDDPDTEKTAANEKQADKLELRIDRALAGLGSQKKRVARVMISTCQTRVSCSYRYTDPRQKPSMRGERFRFLIEPPTRRDLWDEWMQLLQEDWRSGTNVSREFYLANFDAMNAGAVVSNEHRRNTEHLTALEFYFDCAARFGIEYCQNELDNDPQEVTGPSEDDLTPHRVQRQLSGFERGIVPPDCRWLTQGIDVRKTALHWVVKGWRVDERGLLQTMFVIDYGVHETFGTIYGSDEGVELAVRRAILERMDATSKGFLQRDGVPRAVDLTLIDSGYQTHVVYAACATVGSKICKPIKGFGRSHGCVGATFHPCQRPTKTKKPGNHWFLGKEGKAWYVGADADHWKKWEQGRWLTALQLPGAAQAFGVLNTTPERLSDDERRHHSYARHICSETEQDVIEAGKLKRVWRKNTDNNHWLDASCYADVAGDMLGVRLDSPLGTNGVQVVERLPVTALVPIAPPAGSVAVGPQRRPTLQELAEAARRG